MKILKKALAVAGLASDDRIGSKHDCEVAHSRQRRKRRRAQGLPCFVDAAQTLVGPKLGVVHGALRASHPAELGLLRALSNPGDVRLMLADELRELGSTVLCYQAV